MGVELILGREDNCKPDQFYQEKSVRGLRVFGEKSTHYPEGIAAFSPALPRPGSGYAGWRITN